MSSRIRVCAALLLMGATTAHADEHDARVREALAWGIESTPAWRLDASAAPALVATFHDRSAPRAVRLRALSALARLDTPASRALFAALIDGARARSPQSDDPLDPHRSPLVARRSVDALVALRPDDATVDRIAPLLGHGDERVRRAVAQGLARVASERARAVARAHLGVEPSPQVRALLSKLTTANSPPQQP